MPREIPTSTRRGASATHPMSMIEGLGSLLALGGGLTMTGVIPNPDLLVPLVPLGLLGIALGIAVLWVGQRLRH